MFKLISNIVISLRSKSVARLWNKRAYWRFLESLIISRATSVIRISTKTIIHKICRFWHWHNNTITTLIALEWVRLGVVCSVNLSCSLFSLQITPHVFHIVYEFSPVLINVRKIICSRLGLFGVVILSYFDLVSGGLVVVAIEIIGNGWILLILVERVLAVGLSFCREIFSAQFDWFFNRALRHTG